MDKVIHTVVTGFQAGAERGVALSVEDYNRRIGFSAIELTGFFDKHNPPECESLPDWLLPRSSVRYQEKFELSIDASDGAVIFSPGSANGVGMVQMICKQKGRPCLVFDHDESHCPREAGKWIAENRIVKLAAFGMRESKMPGIQERVFVSFLDIIGQAFIAGWANKKGEMK